MKKYAGTFKAVHKRIGLDILDVDVGVVDGRIVVFEANACMNYLTRAYGKDGRWLYRKDYVKGLKRAVKKYS
jgi:hypothetical protein